jgi:hypothetical protein
MTARAATVAAATIIDDTLVADFEREEESPARAAGGDHSGRPFGFKQRTIFNNTLEKLHASVIVLVNNAQETKARVAGIGMV